MTGTIKRIAQGAIVVIAGLAAFGAPKVVGAAALTFNYAYTPAVGGTGTGTMFCFNLSVASASGDEVAVVVTSTANSGGSGQNPIVQPYASSNCSGSAVGSMGYQEQLLNSRTGFQVAFSQLTASASSVLLTYASTFPSISAVAVDITPSRAGTFAEAASNYVHGSNTGETWASTENTYTEREAFVAFWGDEGSGSPTASGTNWPSADGGHAAASTVSGDVNATYAGAESVASLASSDALSLSMSASHSNGLYEIQFKCPV